MNYASFNRLKTGHTWTRKQDGAPPHYANTVRNFLNEKFPGTWMGRRGSIELAGKKPGFSPPGLLSMGGIGRPGLCQENQWPWSFKGDNKAGSFNYCCRTELLRKVCLSVTGRMQECTEANGGHFEQKRWKSVTGIFIILICFVNIEKVDSTVLWTIVFIDATLFPGSLMQFCVILVKTRHFRGGSEMLELKKTPCILK